MRIDRSVWWTGGAALLLAVVYLVAPPLGTDLSAQVERAHFFAAYGLRPVDFGWYGGTVQFGYSLVSPAVMALLGVRVTGAVALVFAALALSGLLVRTAAPRPVLGSVVGAVCIAGNLVSGRVTYALGVAFGLAGLLALTSDRRWVRLAGGAAGAFLAAATSPVAGLFVGLCAAGLLLALAPLARRAGQAPPAGRRVDALVLGVAAAVPIGITSVLFGEGGWMNISGSDTVHAVLASLAVALLVARRTVRIGAVLSALGVLAAFVVHTPVGLNATRLVVMFALPVVAGYGRWPAPDRRTLRWRTWRRPPRRCAEYRPARTASPALLAVALVALALWEPPVLVGDLRDAGNPSASAAYFAPLRAELARRQPVGRIEVPPTRDYWEAAYATPLARGWLRQVDLARNPLFFAGTLAAAEYRSWLVDNGVQYVATADVATSWVGAREAALIRAGQPYLTPVWRSRHWTLYAVRAQATNAAAGPAAPTGPDAGAPALVDTGADLASVAPDRVTVDVRRPGRILVRIRWSRWLTVAGPAGARLGPDGPWAVLTASTPGRYTISSRLTP